MKKYISILVGLITSTSLVFAANDVTLTGSGETLLSVSGYTLNVSGVERVIDSISVNSANFEVVLSTSKSFGVTSADRRKFTVTAVGPITKEETCTATESRLTVFAAQDSGTVTVTVTPSTTETCSGLGGGGGGGGGGGSSSGGGGGGGGGSITPATPATPAVPKVSPAIPATPASPALERASERARFSGDLARGHRNDDVKRLQELLAQDKELYPEGLATGLFGPATERAVRAFQKKYGLPQVGRVGPATRAKLDEVYGGAKPATPAQPAAPAQSNEAALQAQLEAAQKQLQGLMKQLGQ